MEDWETPLEIDLTENSVIIIAGPNGSGKTLMLEAVNRTIETIRTTFEGQELEYLKYKKWINSTPIKFLQIDFRFVVDWINLRENYGRNHIKHIFHSDFIDFMEDLEEKKLIDIYDEIEEDVLNKFAGEVCEVTGETIDIIPEGGWDWYHFESGYDTEFTMEQFVSIIVERRKTNNQMQLYHRGYCNLREYIEISEPLTGRRVYSHDVILETYNIEDIDNNSFLINLKSHDSYPFSFPPNYLDFREDVKENVQLSWRRPICSLIKTDREFVPLELGSVTDAILEYIEKGLEDDVRSSIIKNFNSRINELKLYLGEIKKYENSEVPLPDSARPSIVLWPHEGSEIYFQDIDNPISEELMLKIFPWDISNINLNATDFTDKIKEYNLLCEIIKKRGYGNNIKPIKKDLNLGMNNFNNTIRGQVKERFPIYFTEQTILNSMTQEMIVKDGPHLSSGQKHLRNLIESFILAKNIGLMLIDEPEISLHVKWQREYISMLYDWQILLGESWKFPVIMSTHSPDIIYHHPELIVTIPPIDER